MASKDDRIVFVLAAVSLLASLAALVAAVAQPHAEPGLYFLAALGAYLFLSVMSRWVREAARKSRSALVRLLETLRSYVADEPASYEKPPTQRESV